MSNLMGKIVVCTTVSGAVHAIGIAFSYCDAPTYAVDIDGSAKAHWRADLMREATPEETIDYWRNRAIRAESGQHHE